MPEYRRPTDAIDCREPGGRWLPTFVFTCARMPGLKDFQQLSTLLPPLPETGDRPIGGVTQTELERRWPRCAGPAADTSFPLLFRSGRLVVFTESAIWATELRHQQRGLIEALADLGMTTLEVRAIPRIFPPPRARRRNIALSMRNSQAMAISAEGLDHPALREAVKRIAARAKPGPGSEEEREPGQRKPGLAESIRSGSDGLDE